MLRTEARGQTSSNSSRQPAEEAAHAAGGKASGSSQETGISPPQPACRLTSAQHPASVCCGYQEPAALMGTEVPSWLGSSAPKAQGVPKGGQGSQIYGYL